EASLFGTTSSETLIINPTAHPKYLHTQEEWWAITGNLPKATRKYRKYTDNEKHNRAEKGLEAKEGYHFLEIETPNAVLHFEMFGIPRGDCSLKTNHCFALSVGQEVMVVNPWFQQEFATPPQVTRTKDRVEWLRGISKGVIETDGLAVIDDGTGGRRYRMTIDTWNQMKIEGGEIKTGTPGCFSLTDVRDSRAVLGPLRWDDPRLVSEDAWLLWVDGLPRAERLHIGNAAEASVHFLRNGSTNRLFSISWLGYKEPRAGTTECFVVVQGVDIRFPVFETAMCIEDYDLDKPDRVVDAVGLDTYLKYADRAFPGLDSHAMRAEFAGIRREVEARQALEGGAHRPALMDGPARVRSCILVRALEDQRWLIAGECLPGEYAWDNVLITRLSESPQIWEGSLWTITQDDETLYVLPPEDPDTQRGWLGWTETLPHHDSITLTAPDGLNTVPEAEDHRTWTDPVTGTSVALWVPSGPGSLSPDDCIYDTDAWFLIRHWSNYWTPARFADPMSPVQAPSLREG
ncbi:hypothetical protein AB0885_36570, partial [Streptomyces sp. NPDC005534]